MNLSDNDRLKLVQNSRKKDPNEKKIDPVDYYYRRLERIQKDQNK